MAYCVCLSCGRRLDCSGDALCEVCETDREGFLRSMASRAPTPAVMEGGSKDIKTVPITSVAEDVIE